MSIPIVFIEGGIGCGKSTLVKHMQAYCEKHDYKYLTIQEPVDTWMTIQDESGTNIIEAFYKDQTKYGFTFQMMAYISRLQRIQEAFVEAQGKYDFIICERSLFTDKNVFCKMLYDEGKINTYGYQIYNKWFEHFQSFLGETRFVYLKTDFQVCLERVKKRQREGEAIIEAEYLKSNNAYHDNWLLHDDRVMILDGNQDCEKTPLLLDTYCAQIIESLNGYKQNVPS